MNIQKFRIVIRNGPKSSLMLLLLHWISYNDAKMIVFVPNGQSWCESMSLMLNSIFVNLECSRRPMRGSQVSTWPWLINRNLNFSCNELLDTLIVQFSRFSFLIEFFFFSFIFPHFLTSQTCLVRPNLQAWVAKSRFSHMKEDLEARSMVN